MNFLKHEELFFGISIGEAYAELVEAKTPELEKASATLGFANWGPTTDRYVSFLTPIQGKLYLTCGELPSGAIHSVQITPYEIIRVLEDVCDELAANPS